MGVLRKLTLLGAMALGIATAASAATDADWTAVHDDELVSGATLDDYLRYAARRNPGLEAAYYAWQAARERAPQARALPDPRLTYGLYIRNVETFTGPQRNRLGGAQTFPWPGKLALRGDIAATEATAARAHYDGVRLALAARVTEAYAERYYLTQAIAVTRTHVELLAGWETLARARYRVGTGSYPDVIKAQVELGKLEDRRRTLEDLRRPTRARLNALLDRDPGAELPEAAALPARALDREDAELLDTLTAGNTALRADDAAIEAATRRIALAKKNYLPDLTLGVEWIETGARPGQDRANTGEDPIIATVSVNLPIWWQKYAAGVREARAQHRALERRRRERAVTLESRLQLALFELRDSERKIALYASTLIPKAREGLDTAFTAYESGRAAFLDLLDAERLLLEFHLARARALTDHATQRARIEALIGAPLAEAASAEEGS